MSTPSPYLAAAYGRLADRRLLASRDMSLLIDGARLKGQLLDGLLVKIIHHRREDLAQLHALHQASQPQWAERLNRLDEWKTAAALLWPGAQRLRSWHAASTMTVRVEAVHRRHRERVQRTAERLEKEAIRLAETVQQWSDRVTLKDMELREYLERRGESTGDIVVPAPMKRGYLQFLYDEREAEGRFSREIKAFGLQVVGAAERLRRWKEGLQRLNAANPVFMRIQTEPLVEAWRPEEARLHQLAENSLRLTPIFEQGRQRLRGIYDTVQRMRMVDVKPKSRPLLYRLFNLRDE